MVCRDSVCPSVCFLKQKTAYEIYQCDWISDVCSSDMEQALDLILRLFRGEVVTEKTDWYSLKQARLHLLPYSPPFPGVAVASAVTPSGGRRAGRYDLGMLCVAAAETTGFDALTTNWQTACEIAAEHGRTMDPRRLRLVAPVHLAEAGDNAAGDAR